MSEENGYGLPFDPVGTPDESLRILNLDAITTSDRSSSLTKRIAELCKTGGSLYTLIYQLHPMDVERLADLFTNFGRDILISAKVQMQIGDKFDASRDFAVTRMEETLLTRDLLCTYEGMPLKRNDREHPDLTINYEVLALGFLLSTFVNSGGVNSPVKVDLTKLTLDESLYSESPWEWVSLNPDYVYDQKGQDAQAPQKAIQVLQGYLRRIWKKVLMIRKKVQSASIEDLKVKASVDGKMSFSGIATLKFTDEELRELEEDDSPRSEAVNDVLRKMKS